MSLCEVRVQSVQQIGGLPSEEHLAIVPDIQSFLGGVSDLQGYPSTSDSPSSEEEDIDLLDDPFNSFTSSAPKRRCVTYTSPTSTPEYFTDTGAADKSFSLENYNFEADGIFVFGGNQPANSGGNLTATNCNQTPAKEGFDLQGFASVDFFPPRMQQQSAILTGQVAHTVEKYELVITEQPEEVSVVVVTK